MNPILLDFPEEFETDRLFIRLPKPGDGHALYNSIMASMIELKPWMPFVQKEVSENDVETNVREAYVKFLKREDLRLHIFLKETGEFIAASGLHRINWDIPKFEIGYWIDTRYSGKGFMTEAVQGIVNFALNELNAKRVEIRCDSTNLKSRAIPERLGFVLEGTLVNSELSFDTKELRDTCIYAKVI
ncbi:GNAT family N-acetyltransferase [Neobacillus sp. LXY-4]|uniref:GNAT family N-acetyltransferase n=1 Tax=Neobacillus sp. LXY-4 TaxID=3379826 RepID=UPI003EE08620